MTSTTAKEKLKWKRGIEQAIEYMNLMGWDVQFYAKNDSKADPSKKLILINSRHPIRVKYYVLLHEIGHAMEMSSIFYKSAADIHGPKYNTLVYRIGTVKEEFEAWDRGQQIATSNSWPMDDYFYVVRARFISSYMIWANNRKHPHAKYSITKKRIDFNTEREENTNQRLADVQGLSQDESFRLNRGSDSVIGQKTEELDSDKKCKISYFRRK